MRRNRRDAPIPDLHAIRAGTRGVNPKLPLGALVVALYTHWTVGDWGSVAKFPAPSPRGAAAPAGTLIAPLTGQKSIAAGTCRDTAARRHGSASAARDVNFLHCQTGPTQPAPQNRGQPSHPALRRPSSMWA
jgi:hypothetical protein